MNLAPFPIVVAGGGGMPMLSSGFAVAGELSRLIPASPILFATSSGDASSLVRQAGHEPLPLRGNESSTGSARGLAQRWSDYHAARRFLRRLAPAAVLGLGGEGTVPVARAAVRLDVPCVILEPNADASTATRSLARWAAAVCLGFAQTRSQFRATCPVRVTGVPIFGASLKVHSDSTDCQSQSPAAALQHALGEPQLRSRLPSAALEAAHPEAAWRVASMVRDVIASRRRFAA